MRIPVSGQIAVSGSHTATLLTLRAAMSINQVAAAPDSPAPGFLLRIEQEGLHNRCCCG